MGGSVAGVLFLAAVASTPASPFHPLLPHTADPAGPLGWTARFLGLDSLSRDALAGVGIVAVVAAVLAFLYALREAWRGTISLRLAIGLGIAFHALAVALPLLFSRDVYSYGMYGRIWSVYHANPYVAVPTDFASDPLFHLVGRQWRETPAVYGPAFTLLSGAIARLVRDPAPLILVYKTIAGAASVATFLLVAALARRTWPSRAAFAVVLLAWNPVVLFQAVGGGHNDLLVGLAITAALALVLSGRTLLATAVLAIGALVKAAALVPLVLLLAVVVARKPPGSRWRALLGHGGIAAALAVATAMPFFQTTDPTLGQFELAGHEGWLAPSNLFATLLGKLGRAVAGDLGAVVLRVGVRVAFPVVLAVAFWAIARHLVRRAGELAPEALGTGWAWALLILTLTVPVLLPWYVAWTLPLVWLLPRVPRVSAIWVSAALGVSEVIAEPLRSRQLFEGVVLALHYAITPIVFGVLVWLLRDLRRRLRDGTPLEEEPGQEPPGRHEGAHDEAARTRQRHAQPIQGDGREDRSGQAEARRERQADGARAQRGATPSQP